MIKLAFPGADLGVLDVDRKASSNPARVPECPIKTYLYERDFF